MRFVFRFLVLANCVAHIPARADVVLNFNDLTVPAAGYFNGDPGTLSPGQSVNTPWSSAGVSFANMFGIDSYGGFNYEYWYGFAYSNVVNTTDSSFTNQYASKPGGGYGGSATYAVAYDDGAAITLPVPTTVSGFQIANTTYTYGVMTLTDPNGFSTPLATGTGWFAVTATGKLGTTTTGSATFSLAELRGTSPPGVLATWTWFDLTALGTVDTITFTFDGSDQGAFGLNTPAYFAMDDLTVTAVPEPATIALLAGGGALFGWIAVRRRVRTP